MNASRIIECIRAAWRRGLPPFSAAAIGLAVACVAIATGLRLALGLISSDIVPFATYYPAILLVTFVAGAPAGTLSLLLSAITAWWFFLPPPFAFFPLASADAISLLIYLFVGGIIVWTVEKLRRMRRQVAESLEAAS